MTRRCQACCAISGAIALVLGIIVGAIWTLYAEVTASWAAGTLHFIRASLFAVRDVLTWQWVALLAVLVLLLDQRVRAGLTSMFGRVQALKGLGVEITLVKEITDQTAPKISKNLKEAFAGYRGQIDQDVVLLTERHQIHSLVGQIVDKAIRPRLPQRADVRATIHVADPLIANAFYQVIEYYPSYRGHSRGRTLSSRFGMIGLAWRLERHQIRGNIPRARPGSIDEEVLIRNWGMTQQEALTVGRSRESMSCFMLFEKQQEQSGRLIGLLYVDADKANVFNDEVFADRHGFDQLKPGEKWALLSGIDVELDEFETWDASDQNRRIAEIPRFNTLVREIEEKVLEIDLPKQLLAVVDKLSEKNLRVDIYDA